MIVGATSGDTGSAAMEAVRHSEHVDIVVLFPHGRTSDIQRRQMTTIGSPNVHAVAVEGTFDDCQDLVKAMFADEGFRARNRLSAVNSINWARVMAQIVYYVWAAQRLGRRQAPTTFCVPTGNFGNVFAGHVAAAMGLPVERFLVASNRNDILTRLIDTGEMVADDVVPTLSPSMDIQISSNLERLLVELLDGNGPATAELIGTFRERGRAALTPDQHERLRAEFAGARLDDDETLAVIADVHQRHGTLIDPHTAVGIGAAERLRHPGETVVTLATAHPAKFPDAVEQATGVRPELPAALAPILGRDEQFVVLPNDLAVVAGLRRRRPHLTPPALLPGTGRQIAGWRPTSVRRFGSVRSVERGQRCGFGGGTRSLSVVEIRGFRGSAAPARMSPSTSQRRGAFPWKPRKCAGPPCNARTAKN